MRARNNPFRSEKIATIPFMPQGISWSEILQRLKELDFRAAIVGPEGSGKTTLLEQLAPRLGELGLRPCWGTVSWALQHIPQKRDCLLLDSGDRVGLLTWRRLMSRWRPGTGLIITAHKPGRLPTLVHCTTSPRLLADVVKFCLRTSPAPKDLHDVYNFHRGNIRNCLFELYNHYAKWEPEAGSSLTLEKLGSGG